MPFVQVKVIEGVFGPEEKGRIIQAVTDAMISVEGEAMRGVTCVAIEEVASGSWAIGGTPLTTADVTSMRTATPATV
jgi:4-oxalocrotonate tautomerase